MMLKELSPVDPDAVRNVREGIFHLGPTQVRVLLQVLRGVHDTEIADALALSQQTVRAHISTVMSTLRSRRPEIIRVCCVELADDAAVLQFLLKAKNQRSKARRPLKSGGNPRLVEIRTG